MQIKDDSLPNVYVCGDVAERHTLNPNSRTARGQAIIAADNVVLAIDGHDPTNKYEPQWLEGLIKLTLGLVSIFCLAVVCYIERLLISNWILT
jgi:NADH dehydrogenase FAD-containing subunit